MARELPTPQRTLPGDTVHAQDAGPLPGILPWDSTWQLPPEHRRLCLKHHFGLMHRVRIHVARQVRIVEVRDTSIAISDRHIAREGGVQVAPLPTRLGVYKHRVRTPAGWKKVHENAKTGEFTMSGRARQGTFWLTWNPTPPILTIMRAKGIAQLLQRPVVPVVLNAVEPRPVPTTTAATTATTAATPTSGIDSAEVRRFHLRQLEFLNPNTPK